MWLQACSFMFGYWEMGVGCVSYCGTGRRSVAPGTRIQRAAVSAQQAALGVCSTAHRDRRRGASRGARAAARSARADPRPPRAESRRGESGPSRNPLLPRPPRADATRSRTRTRARARQGGGAAHSPRHSATCFDVLSNLTLHSLTAVSLEREREKGVERPSVHVRHETQWQRRRSHYHRPRDGGRSGPPQRAVAVGKRGGA